MSRIPLIAALGAALTLGACSYSTESNFLGYRSSTSFATPGAAPSGYYAQPQGYYAQPPAYSAPPADPAYTEAPPAYPPPGYYAPPVYVAPSVGIAIGPRWGWGRWGRWRR